MKLKVNLIAAILLIGSSALAQKVDVKKAMQASLKQTEVLVKNVDSARAVKPNQVSPRTVENGQFKMVVSRDWTSGFFPAQLWFYYQYTKDEKWLALAKKYTEDIKVEQFNKGTHDLGFMIYCPFGNGYKLTKDEAYKDVIIQAAKSLSTRFNAKAGVIKSWDHNTDKWKFPVIIDNMMNLELLFYASKVTKDDAYKNIAIKHAEQTMKNHLRADYGSYHVINYDPKTGKVLHKQTLQGFSDESTWARGQAWGIYGFTTTYRETKDKRFLNTAVKMADFFLDHPNLPSDGIPYWDFNAGQAGYKPDWNFDPKRFTETPRDASAAAIASSAMLELSTFLKGKQKEKYYNAAVKMLKSLSTDQYLNTDKANPYFLLKHSTGNLPSDREIDVPLIYADYYFLEGLLRYQKLKK